MIRNRVQSCGAEIAVANIGKRLVKFAERDVEAAPKLRSLLDALRSLPQVWTTGTEALRRLQRQMAQVPPAAPAPAGLTFEDVTLRTLDGFALAAWYVPCASKRRTAGLFAVVHHFHGGGKAAVQPWIKLLHELGVPCIAFDGRGHGASTPLRRGQKEALTTRREDVRAACVEARRRGACSLLLIGQSQGGGVPVLAMAAELADVVGVVVESGPAASSFSAGVGLAEYALASLRPTHRALTRTFLAARLVLRGRPLLDTVTLWSSLLRLRTRPLLWIHGERDRIIPRSSAELWFRMLRSRDGSWRALSVPQGRHASCVQLGGRALRDTFVTFIGSLQNADGRLR